MRKIVYTLVGLLIAFTSARAQVILNEGFETESTQYMSAQVAAGEGWTQINGSPDGIRYNWHNYYTEKGHNTGSKHVASVDAMTYEAAGMGLGPREEVLLSPELDLNDTYQLSFDWSAGPMAWMDASRYDLQVRIVIDGDLDNAETIFSIQNNQILKISGVDPSALGTWDAHNSKIGLEEWKGQKVRLAFVYQMFNVTGNQVCLDNVIVQKYTPETGPRATISQTSYVFPEMYVGEKLYSEIFVLKNAGLDGLKITSVDAPLGVSLNIDTEKVNLERNATARFQLCYEASLMSPAKGNVVLHTNGGDITISFTATKNVIPDGYVLENMETFPPVGWNNRGWSTSNYALEGDLSAYASGSFSDCILTSPRLNVKEGDNVTFTYYNDFTNGEGDQYQYNDIIVQMSYDGGSTWKQVWVFDYEQATKMETVTLSFDAESDNALVRWINTAAEMDDNGALPYSTVYLDRIILPEYYGSDLAPQATVYLTPENDAEDIYPRDILLSWKPVLFADGYRVYVYKNDGKGEGDNLVDGIEVTGTSYNIEKADYETTYAWKVVPFNAVGSATRPAVWYFTTQKDATVLEFPYVENFDNCGEGLPTGWVSENTSKYGERRNWSTNTSKYWGNTPGSLYSMWLSTGEYATVTTPEFMLPAGADYQISFVWGNNHPASLLIDETGLIRNSTPAGSNNGFTEVIFEVISEGQTTQLGYISEPKIDDDYNYWVPETFNLSQYAGHAVQFRWTHRALSGRDNGAGLDNILIEQLQANKAEFNVTEWAAGKVNWGKSIKSGTNLSLINKGSESLTIKSISFASDNFSTTLKAGDVVPVNSGIQFAMQFDAKESAQAINDNLTVEFEGGYSVNLPVSGTALAKDVLYYAFEDNALDYVWNEDFTLMDVDRQATISVSAAWIQFQLKGAPFAFAQGYDSEMYGIMAPPSGDGALIASAPANGVSEAEDWIVSKPLYVNENSTFEFTCRNWESLESVLPNEEHYIEVLVSTTSATDRKSFTSVMKGQQIPFLTSHEWKTYTVNLNKYAGQQVYVALKHYTVGGGLWAFFDDFTFNHVADSNADGIASIVNDIDDQSSIYSLDGVLIGKGKAALQGKKGIFIVDGKKIAK